MPRYLIGFSYHDPDSYARWQRGEMEDFESSTGLWVWATTPEQALEWGRRVAAEFQCDLLDDATTDSWGAAGHHAWIEEIPEDSGWNHCLSFFSEVRPGQMPDFTRMGTDAYLRWMDEAELLSNAM
jgi:hypothetical protein